MFSCLISHQSWMSCQFHVRKICILLIFSWVNDFRKKYKMTTNIKWFTGNCSYTCCSSVFTKKKTCVLTEICCVLLAFTSQYLGWCGWHLIKQIFHAFFCLISKQQNIQLCFASLNINYFGWIISDIKQEGMEYLFIKYKNVHTNITFI